jgi:hypothetical protein
MRLSKKYAVCLLLSLVLTGIMAMGASPDGKPEKEPIDKIEFVHYPKENNGNANGKPGGTAAIGSGVLSETYSYSEIRWADPRAITYYVNPNCPGVDSAVTIAAVNAAMVTWDNACGPLGYVYNGTTTSRAGTSDNKNVISWANITKYKNAIAVTSIWYTRTTKQIIEVDTQMNTGKGFTWSYTAPNVTHDLSDGATSILARYTDPTNPNLPAKYDIRDIMTHEAGHWIMLNDLYNSRDSELTMYGYGSTGELKKDTLGYGDELGVEYVYPP